MLWVLWALARVGEGGRLPHSEPPDAADREVIGRVARGDADALGTLYDRHGRAVYSLAFRVMGDAREAEEVVQDTFAQAWKQAARYDAGRGPVVAWLLMITRSRAIDRLRSRRGLPAFAGDAEQNLVELTDPGVGPERLAVSAEQAARVRAALLTLPLVQRLVIELAFFEGLTHAEIAEQLEQPLGTIKTRIRLGLMKLKDVFLEASHERA